MSEETVVIDQKVMEKIKEELNTEIESTTNKIVTDDVKKQIEEERKKAAEEARLQFEKDQLAKEQEERIKKLEEEKVALQKEAHTQIESLKTKVDEMISSKAVYTPEDSPLNKTQNNMNVDTMSYEEMMRIEDQSRDLFLQKAHKR